jgi:YVTN family beta-propeller protein
MGDLVTNLAPSPDGRVVIVLNSGFMPHALTVLDAKTHKQLQSIPLKAAWLGMSWSPDGRHLYVSGGNTSGEDQKPNTVPTVYEFNYADGRLAETPAGTFAETIDPKLVWWSGVAYLPAKHWLYTANHGTGVAPSNVVVFDTDSGKIVTRIPVEVTPYQTLLSKDDRRLFVSNWSSDSISVIDTSTNSVIKTIHVGNNPNDMKLSADGRLFVACSNDNSVWVIDTRTLSVMERVVTTLTPLAPEGSTPNALVVDDRRKLLYVANADNNSVAVVRIADRAHSSVAGFIPAGWYPSALTLVGPDTLYIGNAKGESGHPDPQGGADDLGRGKPDPNANIYTLQTSSVEIVPVGDLNTKLAGWTSQVTENTPYRDSLLSEAPQPRTPSVIPQQVGAGSPIQHVIYIIKENRTYDQVFGDLPHGNGDAELAIFGQRITPNLHALATQFVTLDNLYCDGEVSVDGHSWSNSAYATDFNEKDWPALYGGRSNLSLDVRAMVPSAGHLWDLAKRKGLTYRSYGEFAARASKGTSMEAAPGAEGLLGHVATDYNNELEVRDTDKVNLFLKDMEGYEAAYDGSDAEKKMPNFVVMSLPEDHTASTAPGWHTPSAMVANNDYAVGKLVEGVSHSRYWPNTAIFIIEDDAQDGPDHVDARRTVGLVISPYVKRGMVDSTLYSTSSMVRSIELLLGLPPMSQYDAAATPMYAAFDSKPMPATYTAIQPLIDVSAMNTGKSYGAKESSRMDFSDLDRAPMHRVNEIIWKSVRGAQSTMPPPVHRFRPLIDGSKPLRAEREAD